MLGVENMPPLSPFSYKTAQNVGKSSESDQNFNFSLADYVKYSCIRNSWLLLRCVLIWMLETLISVTFYTTRWPKLNQLWKWSWYTCMPNDTPFLLRVLTFGTPFLLCVLTFGNPYYSQFIRQQWAKIVPILAEMESFWGMSGYISIPHFRPFLSYVFFKNTEIQCH